MANTNNSLGLSNPNGETFVDYKIDPVGANNAFGAGITSGFSVRPNDPAGMSVLVGGEQGVQDSALVKSASGIIYPVGNSTGDALEVEIDGAPSTNSRIDSIVLSVDTTATTSELNGSDLISVDVVKGTSSASPTAPSDSDIMSEIGAGRAFIVLANITVSAGMTVITAGEISKGDIAQVSSQNVDFTTYGEVVFTKQLGSGVSSGSCSVQQFGKVVTCKIQCKTSSAMTAWSSRVIGKLNCTLPVEVSAVTFGLNNRLPLRYIITTDGTVKVAKDGGTDVGADDITAQTVSFIID